MDYSLYFYQGMDAAEERGCIVFAECHPGTPIRRRNGRWEYYSKHSDVWKEMKYNNIDQMRRGPGTRFHLIVDPEQLAKDYLVAHS